jgi:phosphoribosyl-AMP cyclohydrolase
VVEAFIDCDGDTLLFKVRQEGAGACHTGARTCFDAPPVEFESGPPA